MTYKPFSHGIDFSVILQDPTIQIPGEEFSWLNDFAAFCAASPLKPSDERELIVEKMIKYWPKDPVASGAAMELRFMDEETPSRHHIARQQNKHELLALYLYDSAYQQMMEQSV
jgi:hypothetical protein